MEQCYFCFAKGGFVCKTKEEAQLCIQNIQNTQNTTKVVVSPVDDDFGFVFVKEKESDNKEMQDDAGLDNRANALYNAIIPFLDNLCANPDKPTIYWPNRVQQAQEFKEKLKSILEGND